MRLSCQSLVVLLFACTALAQTSPEPSQTQMSDDEALESRTESSQTAAASPQSRIRGMMKKTIQKAINDSCPTVAQWQPLNSREKFQFFVAHTYAPRTFALAAVDTAQDSLKNYNPEYSPGSFGLTQRYGVQITGSETQVFFGSFLFPTLFKQDPRYFRNPNLPVPQRAVYALTRVFITRADSGHETFNSSYFLSSATSQALQDIYIPGHRQGLRPIADRLTFNLAIDSGFNLLHEFWPDLRRKLFHR